MIKFSPPDIKQLNDYYKSYWKYLKEDDLLSALSEQAKSTMDFLSTVPLGTENFSYADGKWMLKEVIGHLSDTERILSYRALRIARNDKTNLSSFDENIFIAESNFRSRTLKDILNEWNTVRASTLSLFSSMTEEIVDRSGKANSHVMTPRNILYFILVHERHHLEVIKERYLSSALSA